jgi:hypothetical protein
MLIDYLSDALASLKISFGKTTRLYCINKLDDRLLKVFLLKKSMKDRIVHINSFRGMVKYDL